MIRFIKFITLVASITLLFSCEDYLEIQPEGSDSENYFNSEEDYNKALIGAYDLLQSTYLNAMIGEIASDNVLCGGESATDVLALQQIDDMTHTPVNDQLTNVWSWMYAGINRANFIFEFKDKVNFSNKNNVLGQTAFLRAYYYTELVKFFGDVPMFIDKRLLFGEDQTINKTPKVQVYEQIEADLQFAIQNLPWTQAQQGRVTKGAALALLGKVYLYQNKFTEAATVLEQVIASNNYTLVSNYATIFIPSNENNSESVFEIQYTSTQGAGFGCLQCSEGNVAVGFYSPRFTVGNYAPFSDGFSFGVPVQGLVNAYIAGDTRKNATILDIAAFATTQSFTIAQGYEHTGFFNKKYIAYAGNQFQDPHLTNGNNYVAIRYSDVLLMAAEAYNRGNINDEKARTYLNKVRERAFGNTSQNVNTSGSALTQDIWNERRLELAGEGHRFFDLVRTNQAATAIAGFQTSKNELFPIPLSEILLTGNRWAQNQGY